MKKRIFSLLFAVLIAMNVAAAQPSDTDWMPQLNGTLRTRWEMNDDGDMRFQIRNARVSLNGNLNPIIVYRVEADFCDRGSVKPLDVWGRVNLTNRLGVQLGSMRLPFTLGSYRPPHVYLFADRPVTDKEMGSPRNVGVKLIYSFPVKGLSCEGGAFNSHATTDQNAWQSRMAYAAKIRYIIRNTTFLIGTQSLVPDSVRVNQLGAAVSWETTHWLVEGEYANRSYTHNSFKTSHGYNFMADYRFPVKAGEFNRLSLQCRWDGLTDYSDGKCGPGSTLKMTTPAFNRITIGTTLSAIKGGRRCDLRLNYEKYFYHKEVEAPSNGRSKLVAEMVVRF